MSRQPGEISCRGFLPPLMPIVAPLLFASTFAMPLHGLFAAMMIAFLFLLSGACSAVSRERVGGLQAGPVFIATTALLLTALGLSLSAPAGHAQVRIVQNAQEAVYFVLREGDLPGFRKAPLSDTDGVDLREDVRLGFPKIRAGWRRQGIHLLGLGMVEWRKKLSPYSERSCSLTLHAFRNEVVADAAFKHMLKSSRRTMATYHASPRFLRGVGKAAFRGIDSVMQEGPWIASVGCIGFGDKRNSDQQELRVLQLAGMRLRGLRLPGMTLPRITKEDLRAARDDGRAKCRKARKLAAKLKPAWRQAVEARGRYKRTRERAKEILSLLHDGRQTAEARTRYLRVREKLKKIVLEEKRNFRKAVKRYRYIRSAIKDCKKAKQLYQDMKEKFLAQSGGGNGSRSPAGASSGSGGGNRRDTSPSSAGGGGGLNDKPRPDDCRLMDVCPPAGRVDNRRRTSPPSRGGGGGITDMPSPDDCRLMDVCPPAGRANNRRRTSPPPGGGGGRRRNMQPPNDDCLLGVCGPGLRRN